MVTDDVTHDVVHAYLVVEPVKTRGQIATVLIGIIDLAHEDDVLELLLHLLRGVCPELGRHHLGHVAAETVDTLLRPEQQDVRHLEPGIGDGVEITEASGIVVDAIVQLHRLVPVVLPGGIVEVIIARSLGRHLQIGFRFALIEVEIGGETLAGTIVEVVLRVKTVQGIVRLAEVFYTLGLADGLILTGYVVGHEVDDDLQPGLVRALHQLLKLLHALVDVHSQVGVYVVVVGDGIGRTSLTLHHSGMLAGDAVGTVVRLRGMTDDTCIPHMADAHLGNVLQHLRRQVGKLSTTVFGNRAALPARDVAIAEKTSEYLVNDNLLHVQHSTFRGFRVQKPHG